MHSSTAVGAEKNLSFRGRASQPEEAGGGGGVDQDTTAGTTSRPRPDAMANMVFSPHNVELPGFDEIVSGGQIKSAWDPDLPIDLDPPTSSCSSNTSGNPSALAPTVLPEELTRLVSFPDLAKSPLQQAERLDGVVIKALQARTDGYNHQSQKYPGYHPIVTRVKEIEEAKTDIPSTSNNFVSFTDPYPKAILSSNETFFDPSPSSAGTSPTIPAQSETSANSASDLAWKMSPELYIPIDSKLSLMLPTSAGADAAMTNWRPRSAPKTSHSRSPSPFLFWNRKGNQPQQEQGAKEVSEDCRAPETPENADATHVDSVSNHLGKMTPPSGWMEAGSLTGEGDEGDGQPTTPPSITREEYEALPLAIQRKVRSFSWYLQPFETQTPVLGRELEVSAAFPRIFDTSYSLRPNSQFRVPVLFAVQPQLSLFHSGLRTRALPGVYTMCADPAVAHAVSACSSSRASSYRPHWSKITAMEAVGGSRICAAPDGRLRLYSTRRVAGSRGPEGYGTIHVWQSKQSGLAELPPQKEQKQI